MASKINRTPEGEARWKNAIRLWQKDHKPERAASARGQQRKRADKVIKMYGGRCACCGEGRREFLTMDHVNGDGAAERRAGLKSTLLYRRLLRQGELLGLDPRYQVLCYNCNCARGSWGYCPHEREREAAQA